uniref:Early endosome antigen 1 n=1 Tax=Callorhinchus milii TaxID=7868 RepID=A0A4W3IG95_CALMI
MKSHASAEELFKHYEACHESVNESGHREEANQSLRRDDVTLLRQEIQDLQTTLKEERWYSEELKKELDKVQGQLKQGSQSDGLTSAIAEVKQQLEEAQTENMKLKQMKDLLEQKAGTLATELVGKCENHCWKMSTAIIILAFDVSALSHPQELHTELLQRPGVEDVTVLKKELVQVQTLMDQMTLEQEKESNKLKEENEQLKAEFIKTEATITQLKAQVAKAPEEASIHLEEMQKVRSMCDELQQQVQNLSATLLKKEVECQQLQDRLTEESLSKKSVQTSLHEKELDRQQVQAKLSAAEGSLQRVQNELNERGDMGHKLKVELSEVETKHQQLRAEFKQVQQQREEKEQQNLQLQNEANQLHAKLLETERQLGEVQGRLKEQRQLSGEKLKDKEQLVADLQLKLSRTEEQIKENVAAATEVQHQLEKQKQQHQELQTTQQTSTSQLREAQNDLEQVLRQIGDKDQKIQNLEALLQKSKDSIVHLETEREELFAKIQAGEGETAVLSQLQEKNHGLHDQVAQLTEKLKNQNESHNQAQENLHKQVQEQKALLRASQDNCRSLESSISDLNIQLSETKEKMVQLDTQVKAKTELHLSAEAAKSAQRADLENHLETAKHALQDKEQELNKTQAQLDEAASKLNEKAECCIQLETNLKEYKEKQLISEQKIEQFETQIKKLESDVTEMKGSKELAVKDFQQLRKQHSDLEIQTNELHKQLDAEKESVCSTKLDLQKKSEVLDEMRKQVTDHERETTAFKQDLETHKEEVKRLQASSVELQALKLERETLSKRFEDTNGHLANVTASLKEAQTQLVKDHQLWEATLGEKVGLCYHHKFSALSAQSSELQSSLKAKEKVEEHLQTKLKELLESSDQARKQYQAQLEELTNEHSQKAETLSKLQQQVADLTEELSANQAKLSEIQKEYETTQANLAKLQSDIYGKESELSSTRQDLKTREEKLSLAQEDLITSRNQANVMSQTIQELKQAKAALEKNICNKEAEIKDTEKTLLDSQKEKELAKASARASKLQEVKESLRKQIVKLTEDLRVGKEESEKELSDLKEAKQLLIQQKLEIQGKSDGIKSMLDQEKKDHQLDKNKLEKVEGELKKQCTELENKWQSELKDKDTQRKKHEESEAKLNMQITAQNENMATLKKEWQSSQRRVSELEKQTDDLRGEIAVLEATVQNNQDERRALLERCLKSEGEIEKLQGKVVEMRRKLDDTTAAMQELGRENQTLQIKQTQTINRKWTEDNDVVNCMGCGKGFSVTLRKHHCRHCGNIFCSDCSSKSALTPSSKKAVRVCATCFEELQG